MPAFTVKVARTLWCPVSDGAREAPAIIGNTSASLGLGWSRCIGDKCAAWRWGEPLERRFVLCPDESATEEPQRPDVIPPSWNFVPRDGDEPAGWIEPTDEMFANRRGYCGMAGAPQHQE